MRAVIILRPKTPNMTTLSRNWRPCGTCATTSCNQTCAPTSVMIKSTSFWRATNLIKPACGHHLLILTNMTYTKPGASRWEILTGASTLASTQGIVATHGTGTGRWTSHATHPGEKMMSKDYKKHTELLRSALQVRLHPLKATAKLVTTWLVPRLLALP